MKTNRLLYNVVDLNTGDELYRCRDGCDEEPMLHALIPEGGSQLYLLVNWLDLSVNSE